MAILNQKRILNLIPKVSAPVTIHVSQGDVGTEIEFTLVKGDEVFVNPGNVTASVHGVREDGANFGAFTCTLSGSKVTFPLHSEMTAVKGSALAEIVIVDNGGNKVGSANFGILVEQSAFPLGVTYDNDVSVYESILAYVQSGLSQAISLYNSLQAQFDQVISGVTVDSEVINARMGYNGINYTTLGQAIRTQIANCEERSDGLTHADDIINNNFALDLKTSGINRLEVQDSNDNVVFNIDYSGQINTSEFSSHQVSDISSNFEDNYLVALKDGSGNIIAAFDNNGFFLKPTPAINGKKVSILGDSISSFDGYNPTGWNTYYPNGNVTTVGSTWWMMVIKEMGMELLKNASVSGGHVCGNSLDPNNALICTTDWHIEELAEDGVDPDIILIYLTTNDWRNGRALGSFDSHSEIPSDGNITTISEAYALLMSKLTTRYPNAILVCITNLEGSHTSGDSTYPIINSGNCTIHEVNHVVTEIAHMFGAYTVDGDKCHVNYWNIGDYTVDGRIHPNAKGMSIIKDNVKMALEHVLYNH